MRRGDGDEKFLKNLKGAKVRFLKEQNCEAFVNYPHADFEGDR